MNINHFPILALSLIAWIATTVTFAQEQNNNSPNDVSTDIPDISLADLAAHEPNSLTAAEPDKPTTKPDAESDTDPDTEPNQTTTDPNDLLEFEQFDRTDQTAAPLDLTDQTVRYWQRHYHPQVTARVFLMLNYPYYPGGAEFAPFPAASSDQAPPTTTPACPPPDSQATDQTPTPQPPCPANSVDIEQLHYAWRKYCDLVHQWRDINESPQTALEVVRAMELTKTATRIYLIQPTLAVNVKRTLGRTRRLNHKFELTSRMMMQSLLDAKPDRMLLARLEKQVSDLGSLLERLAKQNDEIGSALGLGRFDRSAPPDSRTEPIDYSMVAPPSDF